MFLSYLFTYATSVSTWSVIIYVSIPHLYFCHILTNVICHHTCLSHISSLVTSLTTWSACHHMCLLHLFIFPTFLPTWYVIIYDYPAYLHLPPSYQLHQSSYVSIPHRPISYHLLITNLVCYYIWISSISTLAPYFQDDLSSLCVYPTSLPLTLSCQLDLSSLCVYPTSLLFSPLYQFDLSYMCLPHLSNFVTSWSIWSVIIYMAIPISTFASFLSTCHSHIDLLSNLFVSSLFIHNTIYICHLIFIFHLSRWITSAHVNLSLGWQSHHRLFIDLLYEQSLVDTAKVLSYFRSINYLFLFVTIWWRYIGRNNRYNYLWSYEINTLWPHNYHVTIFTVIYQLYMGSVTLS